MQRRVSDTFEPDDDAERILQEAYAEAEMGEAQPDDIDDEIINMDRRRSQFGEED